MKYEQNIPGYMRNYLNNKSKRKYMEVTLGILWRIPKTAPLYMSVLGVFHLYLWAFFISSGNPVDISFIIQKEGITGGIPRLLPLIVSHFMMLIIVSMSSVVIIILVYLAAKFKSWVYRKSGNTWNKRSYICCFLFFGFELTLIYLAYVFLISDFIRNFHLNISFVYWTESGNILPQLIIIFILLIIPILFFVKYQEDSHKLSIYRIILWVAILSISVVPFSMFGGAYSKGYGTECVSLETEDNMIVESSAKMGNGEEGKKILKISEVIQSGGGYVADILSEGKGNKNYILSSYVYSEDKDYLNIMVFSIREWYKDDRGYDRTGNDLLIDNKGEGRNGVLVSIKKSSIKNRFMSTPLCFNGN